MGIQPHFSSALGFGDGDRSVAAESKPNQEIIMVLPDVS